MKFELDLIRAGRALPIDRGEAGRGAVIPTRKAIREATDAVIFDALQAGSMPRLVRSVCNAMLVVARAVDDHDLEPEVDDFIAAAMSLLEAGRGALDLALVVNDWDGARAGAVMIELTVRGMCAALSIDYDAALRAVHEGRDPPLPNSSGANDVRPSNDAPGADRPADRDPRSPGTADAGDGAREL